MTRHADYTDGFAKAFDEFNAAKTKLVAARAFRAAVDGARKEVLDLHGEVVRERGPESSLAQTVKSVHLARILALSGVAARRERQLELEVDKLELTLLVFTDRPAPRAPRRLQ